MNLEVVFGPGQAPPEAAPRTSIRLEGGRPRHADAHRDRLRTGLRALGLREEWLDPLVEQAWSWAREHAGGVPLLALRILTNPTAQSLHVRLEPLPEVTQPYLLLPARHPLAAERENPLNACKGCLGPWNRAVLAEVQGAGAQDALLHWADGTVGETAIAAVGLLAGHRLVLPPTEGRVRSIAELWDLPLWADERGWEVVHAPIPLQEALQGQLWCFNALRGLWPAHTSRVAN